MSAPRPTVSQLRPALELAWERALAGGRPLPGRLRSLVRARRPSRDWAAIRQAVEEDEGFRQWVAESADPEEMPRPPWLWLTRPEGWEDELAELVESTAEQEEEERRRLETEHRIAELEAQNDEARRRLADAQKRAEERDGEIESLRRERADIVRRRDELEGLLAEARKQAGSARREATAAGQRAEELAAQLGAANEELERLREELAAELARSRSPDIPAVPDPPEPPVGDAGDVAADAMEVLREQVGRSFLAASQAADSLARSLRDAAAGFGDGTPESLSEGTPPAAGSTPDGRTGAARPRRAGRARRRPVSPPPGLHAESFEAAEAVVRTAGCLIIVDGYNFAFTTWSRPEAGVGGGHELPRLRQRLVTATSELALRLQREVLVVFDGVEGGSRMAVPAASSRWMRVVFSPSHVEADEEILAEVDRQPVERTVIVVTNDRAVRTGAIDRGANVISVEQLQRLVRWSASR